MALCTCAGERAYTWRGPALNQVPPCNSVNSVASWKVAGLNACWDPFHFWRSQSQIRVLPILFDHITYSHSFALEALSLLKQPWETECSNCSPSLSQPIPPLPCSPPDATAVDTGLSPGLAVLFLLIPTFHFPTIHSRALGRACLRVFIPSCRQCLRWWFAHDLTSWFCHLTELPGTSCQQNPGFWDTDATLVWPVSLYYASWVQTTNMVNCFINTWSWEKPERTATLLGEKPTPLTGKWRGPCLTSSLPTRLGERHRILILGSFLAAFEK